MEISVKLPDMNRRMAKLVKKVKLKSSEVSKLALPETKKVHNSVVSSVARETGLKRSEAKKRVKVTRRRPRRRRKPKGDLFYYRFYLAGGSRSGTKIQAGRVLTKRQKPTGKGQDRGLKIKGMGKVPGSFVHPRWTAKNKGRPIVYKKVAGDWIQSVTLPHHLGNLMKKFSVGPAKPAQKRIFRKLRKLTIGRMRKMARKK